MGLGSGFSILILNSGWLCVNLLFEFWVDLWWVILGWLKILAFGIV